MRLSAALASLGTALLYLTATSAQSVNTTSDAEYPTILSAAGNLTGLPGGNEFCGSQRVRKPWGALTVDEQALYVEATKLAIAKGGVAAFAAIAADTLSQAQGEYSCAFFSHHRRLLIAYESYLRDLDDRFACLTLPYYDVHTAYIHSVNGDCANMFECSGIFEAIGGATKSSNRTTMTYNGVNATGYAVSGSPYNDSCDDDNHCGYIVRDNLADKGVPSGASFSTFQSIVATSGDFATFVQGIRYGVHNEVLDAIGGTLSTVAAARDVMYYSWYSALDMYLHVYHLCRIGVPLTYEQITQSLEVFANATQTCGGLDGVDATSALIMRVKVDGQVVDVSQHPELGQYFGYVGSDSWNYADIQQLGDYSYTYQLPEVLRQQILSNNDMCTGFNRAFAATYTPLNSTAVKSTTTTKTTTKTTTTKTTKIVNGKKVTTTKVTKVTTKANSTTTSSAKSTVTNGQLVSTFGYSYLGNFSTDNVAFGEGTLISNGYTGYTAYYSNGAITTKHNGIVSANYSKSSTSASTTTSNTTDRLNVTYSDMSTVVLNVTVGKRSVARNITASVATSGSYWAWVQTAYNGLYTRFEGNVHLVATHMKLLECYTFNSVYGLSNFSSTFVNNKNLITNRVECAQRLDLMRSGLVQLAVRSEAYTAESLRFASSTVINTIRRSYKRVTTRNVTHIRKSYIERVRTNFKSTEDALKNITVTSTTGSNTNTVVDTGFITSNISSTQQSSRNATAVTTTSSTTTTTVTAVNVSDKLSPVSESKNDSVTQLDDNTTSTTTPGQKTNSITQSGTTSTHSNTSTTTSTTTGGQNVATGQTNTSSTNAKAPSGTTGTDSHSSMTTGSQTTTTPGQPVTPSGPATPTPGQPVTPSGPATPIPGQPVTPSGPATPIPGQPVTPSGPATPTPGQPVTPSGPATPTPGQPVTPSGPATPTPGQPVTPSGPTTTTPGQPVTPSGPTTTTPGQPVTPLGPATTSNTPSGTTWTTSNTSTTTGGSTTTTGVQTVTPGQKITSSSSSTNSTAQSDTTGTNSHSSMTTESQTTTTPGQPVTPSGPATTSNTPSGTTWTNSNTSKTTGGYTTTTGSQTTTTEGQLTTPSYQPTDSTTKSSTTTGGSTTTTGGGTTTTAGHTTTTAGHTTTEGWTTTTTPKATPVATIPGVTPVPMTPVVPSYAPPALTTTCLAVSVEGDATYCIEGPICSGSGDKPNGSLCPMKGQIAIQDCHETLDSYTDSRVCVAPENAVCKKIKTGAWGCVFESESIVTPAPTTPAPSHSGEVPKHAPIINVPTSNANAGVSPASTPCPPTHAPAMNVPVPVIYVPTPYATPGMPMPSSPMNNVPTWSANTGARTPCPPTHAPAMSVPVPVIYVPTPYATPGMPMPSSPMNNVPTGNANTGESSARTPCPPTHAPAMSVPVPVIYVPTPYATPGMPIPPTPVNNAPPSNVNAGELPARTPCPPTHAPTMSVPVPVIYVPTPYATPGTPMPPSPVNNVPPSNVNAGEVPPSTPCPPTHAPTMNVPAPVIHVPTPYATPGTPILPPSSVSNVPPSNASTGAVTPAPVPCPPTHSNVSTSYSAPTMESSTPVPSIPMPGKNTSVQFPGNIKQLTEASTPCPKVVESTANSTSTMHKVGVKTGMMTQTNTTTTFDQNDAYSFVKQDDSSDQTVQEASPEQMPKNASSPKTLTAFASTTAATTNDSKSTTTGLAPSAIVGIVAAVCAVVALAGFTAYKMRRSANEGDISPNTYYYTQSATPLSQSIRL